MKLGTAKVFFYIATTLLALSALLAVASISPLPMGVEQSTIIINDTFHLSPHEIRRQGIGNFHGQDNVTYLEPETVTIKVESSKGLDEDFSVVTYNNSSFYQKSIDQNFTYTYKAGADYYEAVFTSNSSQADRIHFEVSVDAPQISHPDSNLNIPARILLLLSLGAIMLGLLKLGFSNHVLEQQKPLPTISRANRRLLLGLVALSLVVWLLIIVFNPNPLGTFENWYTDHARHPYVASLFLKDGFAVFSQPLDVLASQDSSRFMFVTWPEMPHLYPVGSILLFLPFGALLQGGFDPLFVFKLEIALFLVFAHVCLFLFLSRYWAKTSFPRLSFGNWNKNLQLLRQGRWKQKAELISEYWQLALKLVGVYVIYTTLIIFAADGMFDSVAVLFSLIALTLFMAKRYDAFLLFVGISVLFKYQTGIFLLPIIVVGLLRLLEQNKFTGLLRNWKVISALAFICISGVTAYLSAPYLMETRPELVMNGVNAFLPNSQITWSLQALAVLLTLAATVAYAFYMLNKNSLLALSALFLLIPTFTLPYLQNWYLPFIFIYILIPERKPEIAATAIWLIFLLVMLSFGGAAFNPLTITDAFRKTFGF